MGDSVEVGEWGRHAWPFVRTQGESQILLMRKGRLVQFAEKVYLMLDATSPIVVNT